MAVDINTRIATAITRHMTFIERLENGALKRLLTELVRSQKEIVSLVRANMPGIPAGTDELQTLTPVQVARLQSISQQIDETLIASRQIFEDALKSDLSEFVNSEGEMLVNIINRQIPPSTEIALRFDRLPLGSIERMINTPLGGEVYAERIIRNYGEATSRIKAALTDALIQGESVQQAITRVKAVMGDTLINRTETLVRTEFARVANQANLAAMRQNSDVIKEFMWVSALDTRVCPICMGLHGKRFKLDTNQSPPAHANCRCTMVSVLKSAKDLGIQDKDIPNDLKGLFTGRPPDIPNNFDDFLKSQDDTFIRKALGPARFKLFKQGISVQDMATDTRTLTLDELASVSSSV